MAIDLKSTKQQWLMLTNGKDVFCRQQVEQGTRITIGTPGLFAVFANSEEELLSKVFIDPSKGITDYQGDKYDQPELLDESIEIEPIINEETGEIVRPDLEEVVFCEPKEGLEGLKTEECCKDFCEVISFKPAAVN